MNDLYFGLYNKIKTYHPYNEQETNDKNLILELMGTNNELFSRDCIFHFTSSAWILNKERNKVLFVYHNIYDSWSWVGGHADNNPDLFEVAIKEATEETGITDFTYLNDDVLSLEILPVSGHFKNNKYVSSHIHLNLTFLLIADEESCIRVKPDENSGVMWIKLEDVLSKSNEKWFVDNIYPKLINKSRMV